MGLAEDILDWAASRPCWQQQVLGRLAEGETFGPSEYRDLAQALLGDPPKVPKGGWLGKALGLPVAAGQQVHLLGVRDLANVNALAAGQSLTFSKAGITAVYGDNGSGKTGYARIVKHVVRARHREDVLTNVFAVAGGGPSAVLSYSAGGEEHELLWSGQETGPLAQVWFYDERCGDSHVSSESDVTYRPPVLGLLDALIRVCDGVRLALDNLVKENTGAAVALPAVPGGSSAAAFLQSVRATTTKELLDAACALPEDAEDEMSRLAAEEVRLRASDPAKEKARLMRLASSLDAVAAEATRVDDLLGAAAEESLRAAKDRATQLRAAADVASSASFDDEPVSGVGSQTWRGLWEAARRFSEADAYPGRDFPVTGEDVCCPLCQQPLDAEASGRLHRFHAFMTDDTQRQARDAERLWREAVNAVTNNQTLTPATAVHLDNLSELFGSLAETARSVLMTMGQRRSAFLTWGNDDPQEAPAPPGIEVAASLKAQAEELRQSAATIDSEQFSEMLRTVVAGRADLEGRRILVGQRATVEGEIARLRVRARLNEVRPQTDTSSITNKSTSLARSYVTSLVQDRFTRESDRLGVERVTLQDTGGRKGQLRQRPAFLGAAVKAELPRVLSEGEQTALGLAGFFTEVHLDETRSALVLDDPVTSLDHLRRALVAKRLAEFARGCLRRRRAPCCGTRSPPWRDKYTMRPGSSPACARPACWCGCGSARSTRARSPGTPSPCPATTPVTGHCGGTAGDACART